MKATLQVVKMVYINNDNCFNNFSNMTVKKNESDSSSCQDGVH